MRRPEVPHGVDGYDPVRIDAVVAEVVVAQDVVDIDRLGDTGHLVKRTGYRPRYWDSG